MEDKKTECINHEKAVACIPFFVHENSMMHYNRVNRRMLIIIVTVCLTFVLTISLFVSHYTKREKEWIDLFSSMTRQEAQDGLYQQPDAGNYP